MEAFFEGVYKIFKLISSTVLCTIIVFEITYHNKTGRGTIRVHHLYESLEHFNLRQI